MFIRDEKVFKVKHFYNSHNDGVYALRKMRKVKMSKEKLFIYLLLFKYIPSK